MIRRCGHGDVASILAIVNDAADAYRPVLPPDCWHVPYMSRSELEREMGNGVAFQGWERSGTLLGVMGLQPVRDVTLIRHAYVRTAYQAQGIGGALLKDLLAGCRGRVLVGTWAAAEWAIRFYQRHGFELASAEETDRLLQSYWDVPARQRQVSVVLERA